MFDPNETRNLAADPAQSAALKDMRARLDRWMRATNDPILHGSIPAPKGATANDPDGISPHEPARPV
jgi:N-sulfoglucosamine sulfohydrolase